MHIVWHLNDVISANLINNFNKKKKKEMPTKKKKKQIIVKTKSFIYF